MKHRISLTFAMAGLLFSGVAAFSQSKPGPLLEVTNKNIVALSPSEQTAVDLAQTKLDNISLRFSQMQIQYKEATEQLQAQYKAQMEVLNQALDAARKAHNLPANAVFNGTQKNPQRPDLQPFTFTVPSAAPAKAK